MLSVRTKILALASVLFAILCVAMAVSLKLQEHVRDEIAAITEYHIPLDNLASEIEVTAAEYLSDIILAVVYRQAGSERLRHAREHEQKLLRSIYGMVDAMARLMQSGQDDARNDLSDRLTLARLGGVVSLLRTEIAPIERLGQQVLSAMEKGDAAAIPPELARFEEAYGTLSARLEQLRKDVAALTDDSIKETLGQESDALRFSIAIFIVAAIVGFGVAGVLASRMVVGLRRLVQRAQAVETGDLSGVLPVESKDEIGQLTRAFNHMVGEIQTKERIRDTFGKFLDPKIVAGLVDPKNENLEQADRRVVTIFFSDIAGFSKISEQLTAGAIAKLLNRYFAVATDAIRAHNGVLDKFIGDAVMAFWTAPFSSGDSHAADACLAALAQQAAIDGLKAELPQILGLRRQVPDLVVRMGMATGDAVVGTMGAPNARTYTVIGDTVNTASRFEGINKVYGTRIIVGEDTFRLAQGVVEARELDFVVAAGKTEPVRIYELMAPAGGLDDRRQGLVAAYAEGLTAYRARDWPTAESRFQSALAIDAKDGPSSTLLTRVLTFQAAPPPADWDGVWRVHEK
jgi:adenylate cyclase